MKNKNCLPFESEIEEAASAGRGIGHAAREHLAGCLDCADAFGEHSRLRELISGLEPVTAPADFEFRLRARMAADASRRVTVFGLRWNQWGAPALGLAAAALLLVGGVATYNTGLLNGGHAKGGIVSATNLGLGVSDLGWTEPVLTVPAGGEDTIASGGNERRRGGVRGPDSGGGVSEPLVKGVAAPVYPEGVGPTDTAGELDVRLEPSKIRVDEGGRMRNVSLRSVSFGSETMMMDARVVPAAGQRVW